MQVRGDGDFFQDPFFSGTGFTYGFVGNEPFGSLLYSQRGEQRAFFGHPLDARPRYRLTGSHLKDTQQKRKRHTYGLVAFSNPSAVARRNERERNRVKQVNAGFEELRSKIPGTEERKKLSKVDILRCALTYIRELQGLVDNVEVSLDISETPSKSPVEGSGSY